MLWWRRRAHSSQAVPKQLHTGGGGGKGFYLHEPGADVSESLKASESLFRVGVMSESLSESM